MVIIFSLILLVSVVYLLVGVYTQRELKEELAEEIEDARKKFEDAGEEFEAICRPIFNKVAHFYGSDTAQMVEDGNVEAGLPEELLLLAWGEPEEIESEYQRGRNLEKWFYDAITENDIVTGYKTTVVITNNVITQISES